MNAYLLLPFLLALLLTGIALASSRRRGLLDIPGERSSHSQPTPTGGGIAIVAALLLSLLLFWRLDLLHHAILLPLGVNLALLAVIGWWDDHHDLSVLARLGIHFLAAAVALASFYTLPDSLPEWVLAVIVLLGFVWLINLYNFMDGSHGLAAGEAVFAGVLMAWGFYYGGDSGAAVASLSLALACLGFLPWNFPRARIFMGDVGSGAIGAAFATLALYGWQTGSLHPAVSILALSVFILDSTATLIKRIFQGKRWYNAHKEHVYQRLIASGHSHTGTWLLYQGANLVLVAPVVLWIIYKPQNAYWLMGAVLAVQLLVWLVIYRLSRRGCN